MSQNTTQGDSKSNIDQILEKAEQGQFVTEQQVKSICFKVIEIMVEESNLQRVDSSVIICGDIHGQFYDLLELFRNAGGPPPHQNYLFLGDYVDRGFNSLETILYLITLKVRYPDRITLIRGNHESRQTTKFYGFYDECEKKYNSQNVWQLFMNVFDYMPLGALIDNKVFAVHGGLSPSLQKLDDIRTIDRKQEIPTEGLMCDLLWSDPDDMVETWGLSGRGAGYIFGCDVVDEFCFQNDIQLICRAHQLVLDGYREMFQDKLVTVWSAPNYMYRCGNVGSILKLDEQLNRSYTVFNESDEIEKKGVPCKKSIPDYFL